MYSLYSYISSFIFALLVLPSVCRCERVGDFRASLEAFGDDCRGVEARACLNGTSCPPSFSIRDHV